MQIKNLHKIWAKGLQNQKTSQNIHENERAYKITHLPQN